MTRYCRRLGCGHQYACGPQREEEGNRAGRIRLLSPLRVFLPIKDQLTVRLEGCDQHYAMLKRNLLYTG
jgi:hypothetical protein